MMRGFVNVSVALVLLAAVAALADQRALLLTSKEVVNTVAVVNSDLIFKYTLTNVGEGDAQNVEFEDESFREGFDFVGGLTEVKYGTIAAGENVTHSIIVKPLAVGYYNISAAKVVYDADDETQKISYSNRVVQLPVVPHDDFVRVYDSHVIDWAIFTAMAAATVIVPFFMYQGAVSQSKQKTN